MQTRENEPRAVQRSKSGLQLAKKVLQIHAIDPSGGAVVHKVLLRSQFLFSLNSPRRAVFVRSLPNASAWGRQLMKHWHKVGLMPMYLLLAVCIVC